MLVAVLRLRRLCSSQTGARPRSPLFRSGKKMGKLQPSERFGGGQLRNLDVNLRPLPFLAAYIHLELIPVQQTQALVNVANADASAVHRRQALGRNSHAVVFNLNQQASVRLASPQMNLP